MNYSKALIASAVSTVLLTGCGAKNKPLPDDASDNRTVVNYKEPPMPPVGPEHVRTPIDQTLRSRAISELNKAFVTNDPVLRANAVEGTQRGLGKIGAETIRKSLLDPSPLVRFAGAMAAGSIQLQEAKPLLMSILNDDDANVQVGVRYALHRLGDYRYSHDLETLALNKDSRVRANVVVVLGLLGETSALKILRAMEADTNNSVRLQILESEYRLGDASAVERLYAGSLSQYADEQILCLLALGAKQDPNMRRFLEGQLIADWPEVSLAASRALGMVGADTGYGVATKYATSKEARQRGMAAMALGEIGRSDSQKYLSKLLSDSDASVRLAAATAILRLKA